jgi:cysteine-rich repeat protein
LNTSGVITCSTCDAANNFIPDGAGFCMCDINYILNVSFCEDICGNGINLIDNSSLTCDDTNILAGDGCSDVCVI